MADYDISNVPRRVVYAASGTGPYAFTFEILAASDIAVYKASTLLTLTTDYTVSISSNGTGSVTLVATAGTSNITIVGSKTIARTTDFTTGGDFFANTLNDELDAQTIFIQQVAETAERGLKAPVTDPTDINMTLPAKDGRKGKVLSFDATTGDPIASFAAGDISNAQTYATNAAASASAAASSASSASSSASSATSSASSASSSASTATTQATNASNSASAASTSESNAASSASAASTSASNASTSASNASSSASAASTSATNAAASAVSAGNAQTAAESARDATLAAFDSFDDRYLGSKTSNPTLDNDGNALVAGALYFNSVAGEMRVYTGSAWVAAYVSGTGFLAAANNLSDVASTSTARTNLGLAIGTNVQAYDQNLTTFVNVFTLPTADGTANQVLKTDGSGVLGFATGATGDVTTTGTQTLTNKTISGADNTLSVDGTVAVGFRTIPQNSQSDAYTLVLADSGKHILHPTADTTARTFTIPANGSVAYPVGTAITFVNQNGAGVITIAITTDTMRLAGAGTTGSRTLAANGVATCIKLTSTEWIISGTGLT